jgi:hypothetical protein
VADTERLEDLPVFPNGYIRLAECACDVQEFGRVMMAGKWIRCCMKCGSVWIKGGESRFW